MGINDYGYLAFIYNVRDTDDKVSSLNMQLGDTIPHDKVSYLYKVKQVTKLAPLIQLYDEARLYRHPSFVSCFIMECH